LTRKYSNSEVVTLAVYLLGGRDRFIDTEDIAIKAQELSPGRFGWRKYPERINLELVRVGLSDAAKSGPQGGLLRGTGQKGWTLTVAGLEWSASVARDPSNLTPELGESRERGGSVDAQRLDRERARLTDSAAWAKWPRQAGAISLQDAQEIFRLDSYATDELRITKIDRLRKLFVGEPELSSFIEHLERVLALRT
jgi:hypothetical protein